MHDKKRLAINIVAQLIAFAVSFVINFFLTPFIIHKLGTEAYGFIGLANNFVSYTTLITVALNSMAARFIAVSFHSGDIETAKKYFSSVYYANLFLALIIVVFAVFIVVFLEKMVNIPAHLEWDVKALFGLTFLNSVAALISNIYLVATFIKNRLDLTSLRNIASNLIRVIFVITPFMLFTPHLWYYSVSALIATVFIAMSNRSLTKQLLPDFKIKKLLYDFKLVKELVFAGYWNLLGKLSAILSIGFDLLLANLFIGAMAMGVFSVSKTVPFVILSLCASVVAVFAPKLTEFYAKGNMKIIRNEVESNIRVMSIFSAIPCTVFLVVGNDFFRLWVPTQDSETLYILSFLSVLCFLIASPMEIFWNVFTITNKVKIPSLVLLGFSCLIFATILICISLFENEYYRLLSIVAARFVWDGIRTVTFLPIYAAKCLNLKWNVFYPQLLKHVLLSISIIVCLLAIKTCFAIDGWGDLILFAIFISVVSSIVMGLCMLSKNQKTRLLRKIGYKMK
jgi:O-antigen/teichoic acid export membrane protein